MSVAVSVVHGHHVACECGATVEIPSAGAAVRLRCPRCGAGFDRLSIPDRVGAGPLRTSDAVELVRTPPPPEAFVDRSTGRKIRRVRLRLRGLTEWWHAFMDPVVTVMLLGGGVALGSWALGLFGALHAVGYVKRLRNQGGAVRWLTIADGAVTYWRWYFVLPLRLRVRISEIEDVYAFEGRVFLKLRDGRTVSVGGEDPLDPVSLGWLLEHIRTGIDAARGDAARALDRGATG
jgi:hypothetical protein